MAEATDDSNTKTLTAGEVQNLADRLYSASLSARTAHTKRFRDDLRLASRALRALLIAYERDCGRLLAALPIIGGA